ncbi:MAG: 3-deoxy-D-manno-octulosonic acid kinase [Pseudomonadota bacterium]
MISPRITTTSSGAIIFDEDRVSEFSAEYFDVAYWQSRDLIESQAYGRGSTLIVQFQQQSWVLRHYLRGGLFGKVVNDSYLWLGQRRTRCFREWRLLADLVELDLPVPKPVAARYIRRGRRYTADLITEKIPSVVTLASLISENGQLTPQIWEAVGRCVRRFHEAGVYHADLNAHNIMLEGNAQNVHIIDFDRGYFRPGDAWKQQNLDRLKRSLVKVAGSGKRDFGDGEWNHVLEGYNGT